MFLSINKQMLLNSDEFDKVKGEVYKITNQITGKSYVGQTRSHRLNHGKYRPFGYMGRFKDHIAEANSNKKNQSRYLNSSLLKYGVDKFTCSLILTCDVEDLDVYERHHILEQNTKFPNGYNLTEGGQGVGFIKGGKIALNEDELVKPPEVKEKTPCIKSDYTKELISKRLKESKSDPEHRNTMMKLSQKQHLSKKFDLFKDSVIDAADVEKYIRVIKNYTNDTEYVRVVIGKTRTTFVGKFETTEEIKARARNFITELLEWQNSLMRETP
jgi:hypothetical protein